MKMVPCTNSTKKIMHVGSKTIWPGDTRDVEETLHPDYEPAATVVPEPGFTQLQIAIASNVKDAIAM